MVINIEHGEGNPSIATLLRISDALGVGLPVLVDVERPRELTVTPAGRAPVLWRGPSGGQAPLGAGTPPPDGVELGDWILRPGGGHSSQAHSGRTREPLLVPGGPGHPRGGGRPPRPGGGGPA